MIVGETRKDAPPRPAVPEATGSRAQSAARAAAKTAAPARGAGQHQMAQSVAQIVSVLMRDPSHKNLKIADLEWFVLPPVMAGQFRLAHAAGPAHAGETKQNGVFVPVAAALWARVSPLVDKALSETLDKSPRLSPEAWTSGDILWLMAVAGDQRALPAFVKQLKEKEFKGKQVKMRVRTAEGKLIIDNLDQSAQAA